MKGIITLSVISVLSALLSTCSAECDGGDVDGCSNPIGGQYNEIFRPACNKHDVCYGCGSGRGISRQTCDSAFLSNMREICDGRSSKRRCYSQANTFYRGVRWFGEEDYESTPLYYCSERWVRRCLP